MDTPSQKLAQSILNRLVSEKLFSAEAGKKLLPKLASGKMLAEDWRLTIETAGKGEDKK
jgi:hypothetical protein